METDLDEEEMKVMDLDDEREGLCRMVFKDIEGGIDDDKYLIHAKIWDIYIRQKISLFQSVYYLEVAGYDGKKVLWEVIYDHIFEEKNQNVEI